MANISEYISKIRTAIYGKDVRSSLADGLDAVNKETEAATALSQEIDQRQTSIEKQFDDQIANMTLDDPSSAELVAARTNVNTGESYDTIGRRLDAEHADVTAQFAESANRFNNTIINVKYPPPPLKGLNGGYSDSDTSLLQEIINAQVGDVFYIPADDFLFGKLTLRPNIKILISPSANIKLKDNTNDSLFYGYSTPNIDISGGNLDGNKANNPNAMCLFYFNKSDNIFVDKTNIFNTSRHGIQILDGSNIKLSNIKGDNIFGSGFLITPSTKDIDNITIRDCKLTNVAQDTLDWGVYFNSGDVYVVKNSTMDNVKVDGAYYGGLFPGGDNNQVINCSAKNCLNWRGMWIHDSRNIKVIGGYYANNGRDGIYVQKAHDVDIFAPTCEFNTNNGLGIDSDYTVAGRLQGTNTNKSVRVFGGVYRNNSQGINSGQYSGIRIASVDSSGMKDVTIIGARCVDDQTTPTQKRGIESMGNGSGHIIANNTSIGSIQAGIYVPDAAEIVGNIPNTYNNPSIGSQSWNYAHLKMGTYHLWVDGSGKLRIKGSAPTSDTDGTIVGTQA